MKHRATERLELCLQHLRDLPFVERIVVQREPPDQLGRRPDVVLTCHTPTGRVDFNVEVKHTNLTRHLVEALLTHKEARQRWIVFAPYVGRELGRELEAQGLFYVDAAGNCRLRIGRQYMAIIEGQRERVAAGGGRGLGAAGYQLLFAILARPKLLDGPVRTLADAAGVGKTTAARLIRRLEEDGAVTRTKPRRLIDTQRLFDQWVHGYAATVRPRLLIGRYRTPDTDPEALERRLGKVLPEGLRWAWGGGAAAMRLTQYYRGETTVLHVDRAPADLPKRLGALPEREGPLILLKAPGPLAFEGAEAHTVHPLLVYTELLQEGDERARDAAREVRDGFLRWLA